MKVILTQDVARLGKKGSVVEVPNGYALNQLIPQGRAMPATPQNLKRAQTKAAADFAEIADTATQFQTAAAALSAQSLVLSANMNEQEHLFEAVSADAVVTAAAAAGITITSDMVEFSTPIKQAGEHEIKLVSGGESKSFMVNVTRS